jgi:hypothetical protein
MSQSDSLPARSAATVRSAARHVLGDSPAGRALDELCDDHEQAVRWIHDDRSPDATTISVVGAAGQGKSWLVRQLIRDPTLQQSLRSGNAQADATRRLVWIGPQPPTAIDPQYEVYLHCATDSMANLGCRYLLVDTPGIDDAEAALADAAERALAMSSVLLLVVRRAQVRGDISTQLAAASEGTLVLPVITAIREATDDPALRSDVDQFVARLRRVAPRGEVLPPVLVSDFEVAERTQTEVAEHAVTQIAGRLGSHLAGGDVATRRRSARLQAAEDRFSAQVRRQLADQLPRLSAALEHLDAAVERLPHDVAVELIGSGATLRAGLRARLRAQLMIGTAAIWFPYRSVLGLLNLTHGAWDRLVLALSGSLPSLIGSAWAGLENLRGAEAARVSTDAISTRSSAMIADRIVPLVQRFHRELEMLNRQADAPQAAPMQAPARLMGIESLREQTQQIFDEEVTATAPTPWLANLWGLLGTLLFWGLLAGPIVALYQEYFGASYETLTDLRRNLAAFPKPEFAMVFTSLLLSLLPASLFAMLVLTWVQRQSRQQRAAERVEGRIKAAIEQLQQDGVLRVDFSDPLVDDARRLLRLGR